jgi:hypothetical protein
VNSVPSMWPLGSPDDDDGWPIAQVFVLLIVRSLAPLCSSRARFALPK